MAVAVLAVLAAGLALGPADVTVYVEAGRSVRVACAPPIASAWHDTGNRRLRLRATTGGGQPPYTVSGGGEPWCAERARRRLAGAVALLTVAGIVVVMARRPGADSG